MLSLLPEIINSILTNYFLKYLLGMTLMIKKLSLTKAGNFTCEAGLLQICTLTFSTISIILVYPEYLHTFLHCKCFVTSLCIAAVVGCRSSTKVAVFWSILFEAIKIYIYIYIYITLHVCVLQV